MKRKFISFLLLLAAIVGIAGFWYYQKNFYSKDTLKLEIFSQAEAVIYQEIEYIVKYKNNGNACLEEPKLIFEYSRHSIVEDDILRKEIILEDIYPGQEKTISFKARVLGKEGEALTAKAALSYQPKNLKARYESNTTFTTIIKSVPLTFGFDLPSKIESGKEMRFSLNYFSNIDYPLSNLRCQIEYPSDFEFISATPRSLEKTEWEIGLLNKAEGGRIEVLGKVMGEVGEEKIFKAKLGTWQDNEFILLKETVKGITIIKPSLHIIQQINNNPEYIASPGDSLHYQIFFKNIGKDALSNLFLVVNLEGKAFDFSTIKAPLGEFETGDNSIVFDWRRVSELQFLPSQEEGDIEFWVELKDEWEILSLSDKNPVIKNKVYLSQAKKEFVNKVNSKLVIEQKAFFEDEVFGNSGPIPPKVGETTTYTIMWLVKNYYNALKDAKVKAILPENVKLTGKIFPEQETEKFTFDSESREIVWNMGDLKIGQGIFEPAQNISFQIEFSPEESQKDKTPEIISQAKISGEDTWTRETLKSSDESINTTLPDDATITEQQGIVQ
ncbi:hypothetical protein KAU40_01995 [Candidatus Parcubacteria bacterium]|nr:hypothetical protein [Candidatus Parcubacteria bacterium]